MYSVRRRMTFALTCGFAVLVAGGGWYVDREMQTAATAEFDAGLVTRARAISALTESEHGVIEFDYTPSAMPEFEREDEPEYFEFWLDDGTVLLRSARLDGDLPLTPAHLFSVRTPISRDPVVRDAELPDGRPGRLVQIVYQPHVTEEADANEERGEQRPAGVSAGPPRALVFVLARDRTRLDQLVAKMRLAIFGMSGLAALLAVLFVWRVLARGFRPIESIAAQVEAMDAENLVARVALPETPRELAAVVEQLNALLGRLSESFERERRFTGNVAHELRTPIAELRSLSAVAAKWPDDTAAIVEFFSDVRDVAGRMDGVVADLLLLARCQAGVEIVSNGPVPVRVFVERAWSKFGDRSAPRGLQFELTAPDEVVIESDIVKIEMIIHNLLGNAVSYARPGSTIRCAIARTDSDFRLELENVTDPLSLDDVRRLGEPFWRKDESRSAANHAGLGLSLVSALAGLLEIAVQLEQDPGGVFRVRLSGLRIARPGPTAIAPEPRSISPTKRNAS